MGYVLRPGYLLPPLMFSEEEIDALVLGTRWVADRADASLAGAARDALAKIASVLPGELRHGLDTSALLIGPGEPISAGDQELATIRRAIRAEHKLDIRYSDAKGRASARTIWPFAIGFFERIRVVMAWCELRKDIRHFRTDRIATITPTKTRYPKRRQTLLKEWRAQEGLNSQD